MQRLESLQASPLCADVFLELGQITFPAYEFQTVVSAIKSSDRERQAELAEAWERVTDQLKKATEAFEHLRQTVITVEGIEFKLYEAEVDHIRRILEERKRKGEISMLDFNLSQEEVDAAQKAFQAARNLRKSEF